MSTGQSPGHILPNDLAAHYATRKDYGQTWMFFQSRFYHAQRSFRHTVQAVTANILRGFPLFKEPVTLVFQAGQAAAAPLYADFWANGFRTACSQFTDHGTRRKVKPQFYPHPIHCLTCVEITAGTNAPD